MHISPTPSITKTTPYVGGSSDSRRSSMQSTGSEMEVDRVTESDADHSSLSSAHSSFAADQSYAITPAILGNTPTRTETTSSHDLKVNLEQIKHDFINFKSDINVHNIFVCEDYNKILDFIGNSTAESNTTSPFDSNTSFHKLCIDLFDTFPDILTYSEFWHTYYQNHLESPSGKAIDLLKAICFTVEEKLSNAKTNIQKSREEAESQKTTMTGLLMPVPLVLVTGTLCITILLMSSAPVLSLAIPFLAVDLLIGAVLLHFIRDAWKKYADIPNVLDAADRLEKTLKPIENLVFEVRSLLRDISKVRSDQYFLHKKPGTTQKAREEAATSAEESLAKFIGQAKKLTKVLTKTPHHYTFKNPS